MYSIAWSTRLAFLTTKSSNNIGTRTNAQSLQANPRRARAGEASRERRARQGGERRHDDLAHAARRQTLPLQTGRVRTSFFCVHIVKLALGLASE